MKKINFNLVALILVLLAALVLCFNSFELKAWKGMTKVSIEYTGYDAFLCIGSDEFSPQFGGIMFIILLLLCILSYIYIIIKRSNSNLLPKINLYFIAMIFALLVFSTTDFMENLHPEASVYKDIYQLENWHTKYSMTGGAIIALILLSLAFVSTCIELYKNRKK